MQARKLCRQPLSLLKIVLSSRYWATQHSPQDLHNQTMERFVRRVRIAPYTTWRGTNGLPFNHWWATLDTFASHFGRRYDYILSYTRSLTQIDSTGHWRPLRTTVRMRGLSKAYSLLNSLSEQPNLSFVTTLLHRHPETNYNQVYPKNVYLHKNPRIQL